MQPAILLTVGQMTITPHAKQAAAKHPIEQLLDTRFRQDLGTMQMVKMAAGEEGSLMELLFGGGGRGALTGGLGLGGLALLLGLLGGKQNPVQSSLPLALIGALLGYGGSHLYRNRDSIFGPPKPVYDYINPPGDEFGPPGPEEVFRKTLEAEHERKMADTVRGSGAWFAEKFTGRSPEDQMTDIKQDLRRNEVSRDPWRKAPITEVLGLGWDQGADAAPDIPLAPRWLERVAGGLHGLYRTYDTGGSSLGDPMGPTSFTDPRVTATLGRPADGWATDQEYGLARAMSATRSRMGGTPQPSASPMGPAATTVRLQPAAGPMEGLTDKAPNAGVTPSVIYPNRKPREVASQPRQIPPPVFPTAAR